MNTDRELYRMLELADEEIAQSFQRFIVRLVAERVGGDQLSDLGEAYELYAVAAREHRRKVRAVAKQLRAGQEPPAEISEAARRELDTLLAHYRLGEEVRKG